MSLNQLVDPTTPLSIVTAVTYEEYSVTSATTTGTLSAAAVLGGIVQCNGTSITLTTPTAALLFAALPEGAQVLSMGIELMVNNVNATAVTIAAGTGVTVSTMASTTIAANTSRRLLFVVTSAVTPTFSVYG